MHILMIEDDLDLGFALSKALKTADVSCEWLRCIMDVPITLKDTLYDCVLLDLNLSDGNGMSLLTRWRTDGVTIPIIVITAKSTLDDRLAGLNGGADDYVIKPFAPAEMIARIRAVLRRYARQTTNIWHFGPLSIEPHLATLNGIPLELSRRELQLLLELAREPNTTVPKVRLAQRMEPLGDPVDFATIDVHISNLRKKLGANWIKTVRGIGYLFTP